ncbi:MAG: Holliday junction DNA helicase RuvB [Candidatus Spechtbacteria bacterium RIFCSPLOWO2_01_FULL_46_10]|uniref:Holliday junction branch migration complex subunit RuvB n=1 Tax=Candidatus Spechtbacteria bacterium RIFCSPLOWO2_01_FULL_46_10 TaxID=1802163 RepID=A0A1G2HF70_9BACT|nr:MAG: Holliday junction DNA helicase RuvB [Candidatus Spechtbacteria bacterium RIFCSPLOWO2_01_FULL_46_10]
MSSNSRPQTQPEDKVLDITLRPSRWDEYIGQERTKEKLRIFIDAAKNRHDALDHVLLYGPPGLGKTTLSYIIARELGVNIRVTSGPAIEKVGDIASILTNLSPYDVLFIDEAHRLNKTIEEMLYPAMEQRSLDIILGKGPSARTIQLELPPFTLVAATTRIGLISSPLRSRFGITARLDFYSEEDLKRILTRSAILLNIKAENDALDIIASSSRATPRIANRLLKRVRDYAEVRGNGYIDARAAKEALKMLEVDELGLEPTDKRILEMMIKKFNGGPVGLTTLAAGTYEEPDTIEEVYEPYLLQLGFIERTPRGRVATRAAYEHLGLQAPQEGGLL